MASFKISSMQWDRVVLFYPDFKKTKLNNISAYLAKFSFYNALLMTLVYHTLLMIEDPTLSSMLLRLNHLVRVNVSPLD